MATSALTTLGDFSHKVDNLSKNCFDKTIRVEDISFESLETVNIAGKAHHMRDMAQRSFCFRLQTPIQYLRKCPQDLQALNMNRWLPAEKNEELFFRFAGEDVVRAVFTQRYQPIDNFEIIERVYALGYTDDTKVQAHVDQEFMSLNILDGEKAFKVNGDKFQPGVSFSNSEVGLASLSVAAFLLRLVCTNGMVTKTDLSKSFKHVSGKVLDKFPEILSGVANELSAQKDKFRLAMNSPVELPLSTIETFNRQFGLSPTEKQATEWAWPYEEGNTMSHIVNCYTKASQYEDLSVASSYKLQRTGGLVLGMLK
ncbi:DUF932 domain-containing protein [Thermodesulfobacteriota bacterium]